MKRSPLAFLAAFFALALITLVLGLWQVGWRLEALPVWFWAVPVLVGVFVILGGWLIQQAVSQRSLPERTLLIGAGWGLPTTTVILGTSWVDEPVTPVSLGLQVLLWAGMSLGYGRIMAGQQRPA